jgi:phage anti-repressor protein
MNTNFGDIEKSIKTEFQKLLENVNDGYIISLKALYKWLECDELYEKYITKSKYRENFNSNTLRKNDNFTESKSEGDITYDFIMRKSGDMNIPWFSVDGFKQFCMFSKVKKSIHVRKYFITIEKAYNRVLKQSESEKKAELNKLENDIKKYENYDSKLELDLSKSRKENEKLLKDNINLEFKNNKAKITRPYLENKEDFIDDGNPEYKELKLLRKKHMKEVWVYIVNPDLINKTITKNIKNDKTAEDENSPMFSDFEEYEVSKPSSSKAKKGKSTKKTAVDSACNDDAFYETNYNEYTFTDYNPESDSPYLYYYISGMKTRVEKPKDTHYKVESIFVQDTAHFNAIKAELDNDKINTQNKYNYKTSKKDVYMLNYKELIRIRDSHLQYELFDNLVKETNDLI